MNQVQQEYPRLVLIVDDQEINRDAVEIALEMNRLGDKYISRAISTASRLIS